MTDANDWATRAPWQLVDGDTPTNRLLILVGLSRRPWIGMVMSRAKQDAIENSGGLGMTLLAMREEPIAWLPLPQLRMEAP